MNTQKEILTFSEAADFINVKISKLRSMVFKKEIPYYKVGALVRFNKNDLVAYLESMKVEIKNEGR